MGNRIGLAGIVALVILSACSTDSTTDSTTDPAADPAADTTAVDTTPTSDPPSTPTPTDAPTIDPVPTTATCDGLDSRSCLLPWPNAAFTVADPSTPTGRRLALPADAMPRNADGTPIDVTDQNRADGFSPGSAILLDLPGVDAETSGLAPSTDIGASLHEDAPIVVIDLDTGERVPYWAELDAQSPDDDARLLMVRPAVSLIEGHEHLVVVRSLSDADGAAVEMPGAWTGDENMPLLSSTLEQYGLADATMAWTFPVASSESLAGRALAMQQQAEGSIPTFQVTSRDVGEGPVAVLAGTYDVTNFLSGDGQPGSRLFLDDEGEIPAADDPFVFGPDGLAPNGLTNPNPEYVANFVCSVNTERALPTVIYGHGLLGNRMEAMGLSGLTAAGVVNICATDWIGMSSDDLANVASVLTDLSRFGEVADRMVQGLINTDALGRLVNSDEGFAAAGAFQLPDGSSPFAADGTVFVGNSQGGILGGAASAITDEWTRVVLGVPGINYSLLLTRSSDWPQFQTVFDAAYPEPVDRVLALQVIQLLWDRGENQGYVQHLVADPFPGIPAKSVLMIEAFGDHQVTNVSTEVLARTLGAVAMEPSLAAGRSPDVEHHWGIAAATGNETDGAVLSLWDFGTPAPPTVNLPPSEPEYGEDPHGAGSDEQRVIDQAFTWLLQGVFVPCDGPCTSDVMTR
jgi:hypothetical protein